MLLSRAISAGWQFDFTSLSYWSNKTECHTRIQIYTHTECLLQFLAFYWRLAFNASPLLAAERQDIWLFMSASSQIMSALAASLNCSNRHAAAYFHYFCRRFHCCCCCCVCCHLLPSLCWSLMALLYFMTSLTLHTEMYLPIRLSRICYCCCLMLISCWWALILWRWLTQQTLCWLAKNIRENLCEVE